MLRLSIHRIEFSIWSQVGRDTLLPLLQYQIGRGIYTCKNALQDTQIQCLQSSLSRIFSANWLVYKHKSLPKFTGAENLYKGEQVLKGKSF